MAKIVLFDGDCNFCDRSVQFIIKNDRQATFKFASLKSAKGQELVEKYNVPQTVDSLILIEGNCYYDQSTAALRICKDLSWPWKLAVPLLVVPKPIRDYFYRLFAKNRYKWFGKKDACQLPTPEMRKRFL